MQQYFAMNKVLEQKLFGPMELSHTKQQSPKAVLWMELWARRSKIAAKWARTRAWAGWWFFWEEEEVCGCRNKWRGATMGPRGRGARPGPSCPGACSPCCVLSARYSQIFQKKSYYNFKAFRELLFLGYFYIARIIQKTDRKYYFCFI